MTYDSPSHHDNISPTDDPDASAGSGPDSPSEALTAAPEETAEIPEPPAENGGGRAAREPAAPEVSETTTVLRQISTSLDSFQQRAEHYEETNRLLHARVEALQGDQVRVLLKPVFERLATMQAQAVDAAQAARDRDPASTSDFEFFAISIDELLALYDLEPVGASPGTVFDARLHHGARTVTTSEEDLDGRIQRVQRQGYKFAGAERVMLPARVSVYRYAAPATSTSDLPGSTG